MQIASEIERILADDGRTGTRHLVAQLVELFEGYGVESAKAEGLAEWIESLPKEPTPALREAADRYKELVYDPTLPSLKLGSRLTVEGVEAVVVPTVITTKMAHALESNIAECTPPSEVHAANWQDAYRAMLSAAGER